MLFVKSGSRVVFPCTASTLLQHAHLSNKIILYIWRDNNNYYCCSCCFLRVWAFDHLKWTFDGAFEWFFGRKLLSEDVGVEIFIYSPACSLCLRFAKDKVPRLVEDVEFLFIHLLVHFALDLLKIKSHVWSIFAFFAGGSKIQVTFPHVRVQNTIIQINEKH